MNVEDLLTRVKDSVEARLVYAEPVEKDGATVILAARVFGGGGGGDGQDKHGQRAQGGGLGFTVRPVGAFIIADGTLRWEPAVDVNRLMTVIGTVAVAGLLLAARVMKRLA